MKAKLNPSLPIGRIALVSVIPYTTVERLAALGTFEVSEVSDIKTRTVYRTDHPDPRLNGWLIDESCVELAPPTVLPDSASAKAE